MCVAVLGSERSDMQDVIGDMIDRERIVLIWRHTYNMEEEGSSRPRLDTDYACFC